MSVRYGFYVDTSGCTGCKACQIACKDKNQLPVGVLWRRVIEVQGGSWIAHQPVEFSPAAAGPAGPLPVWQTSTFAYFISAACMHCEAPICVEVCPTQALQQRPDGVVWIDAQRCLGCRYCEMACPYKAPQFDPSQGVMTKCDFCFDLLDQGGQPACVSACQMRVLHFGDLAALQAHYGDQAGLFPLPDPALTGPALVLTPHRAARRHDQPDAQIGNQEEL